MRIGLDARGAAEIPGGRGRYVRELVRHLARLPGADRFALYAREPWACDELDERFAWRLVRGREPLWNVRAARAASRECDVHLSTDSYLTGWFLRVPSVLVLHDLIAFDPARRPNRRDSLIQRATLPRALGRAAAVICPSESSARDLERRFPAAAGRTEVVPLAASERFNPRADGDGDVLAGLGLDRPYALAVGTLEPRKNLPRLIEAYAGLPASVRDERALVIAGARGWDEQETLAAIAAHADVVRHLGYVPEDALPALYRGADVVCYASLYEGFGLPVLEAMRCGAAVLTSPVSSLPEVGGEAVRYADPQDVADIRAALAELLADPGAREELGRRALEQAARFDWAQTARRTLAVLEAAA